MTSTLRRASPALPLAAAVLLGLACPAPANDSTAEFALGGLQFKKDADVAMRAEDLSISTKEVRVAYRFFNTSARDKTALVAFPMPDIVGSEADGDIAVPTENPANLFDFHVTADGIAVPLQLDTKVLANGRDEAARLRAMNIPLMPFAKVTDDALDRLPRATRAEFLKLGLGRTETYGTGGPMVDHLRANWTLKTAFTWTQTFPAGREIRLVQTYKPSVGGSAQTMIGSNAWNGPDKDEYIRKYCIDGPFIEGLVRARLSAGQDFAQYSEQRIGYVLTTGANWAGPIGDFKVTVDKGDARNLISFCGENVRKVGATRFEFTRRDFTPTKDFYVLILTPLGS